MQTDSVAERYAEALLDLAQERDAVQVYLEQVNAFAGVYQKSQELRGVLENPGIPLEERQGVIAQLMERSGYALMVRNFLQLLVDRRRIGLVNQIAAAYGKLEDRRVGRVRGIARSARALSKAQLTKLTKALEQQMGGPVVLSPEIDEGLIGGVRVEIEGRVFDGSLKGQLNKIREELMG